MVNREIWNCSNPYLFSYIVKDSWSSVNRQNGSNSSNHYRSTVETYGTTGTSSQTGAVDLSPIYIYLGYCIYSNRFIVDTFVSTTAQ